MQRRHLPAVLWPFPALARSPGLRYLAMAAHDRFGHYAQELLGLALARAGSDWRPLALPLQQLSQGRLLLELQKGRLDIIWSMTSEQRERELLPVRVPIDRGLLGWRALLVRTADLPRWRSGLGLDALQQRVAGQGAHWPDVEILRANGLRVETVVHADRLLLMLRERRIDYYPRSVLEVQSELALPHARELAVAPGCWLRYPAASYFFLRPGLQAIAVQLEQALDAMASDGSLAACLERHLGGMVRALHLPAAAALRLRNPLLPPATRLDRLAYWA